MKKNNDDDFPVLPEFSEFKGKVYRSYRTTIGSKNLYTNLGVEDNELHLLNNILNTGNYGAESELLRVRPWEYQNENIFPDVELQGLRNFGIKEYRYGRACYYSADEQTSIMEVTYHDRKREILEDFKNNPDVVLITIERLMCQLELRTIRAIDLRNLSSNYKDLTSNNYSFCQRIGNITRESGTELLIAPSARHRGGLCTPILSDSLLKSATETKICAFQVQFFRDGLINISRLGDPFKPPVEWI